MEKERKSLLSRKNFLRMSGRVMAVLASVPLAGKIHSLFGGENRSGVHGKTKGTAAAAVRVKTANRVLLKNGLVVDGTGKKAFLGNVIIGGDKLGVTGPGEVAFSGDVIDCTGLAIAPGIIDMHSHMDWILPAKRHPKLAAPFTAQGVTTFIGGNCGFGTAGFRKNSRHMDLITKRSHGLFPVTWTTMDGYFGVLRRNGITHNLMDCAGYGTIRSSMRGFKSGHLDPEEMKEMLYLMEQALDQGACGISFGLQYEPGVFATMDEMRRIAQLVKKKDKIMTVHMRAYSSLSGTYKIKLFGTPHNLIAIDEMIRIARETGVRMQLSHLIFVGSRTWKTCDDALERIDRAIAGGLDIKFDTYAYHCGTSIINVFLPAWFLAKLPQAWDDRKMLNKLRREIRLITLLLGFGYRDIQITDAKHPDLERYNGMFLDEIAKERKMDKFDCYIDMAKKSSGRARVLNHRYSSLENVKDLMRHPAALFMTDATPALHGVQNPAVYGNFPRFLQYVREYGLISLEEAVRKMSGASAERFGIKKRGLLKTGYAADVMVFDPKTIRDNNTLHNTAMPPDGIRAVFNNGRLVFNGHKVDVSIRAGRILT